MCAIFPGLLNVSIHVRRHVIITVSTEVNATPYQLFITGLLSAGQISDLPSLPSTTGSTLPTIGKHVQVPRSRFAPCTTLTQQIDLRFNPLQSLDYFDDVLYLLCLLLGSTCHYPVLIALHFNLNQLYWSIFLTFITILMHV